MTARASDPLLRLPDVRHQTGLSRTSIYRLMGEGRFPRPRRIGARAVAWPASAIDEWKALRPETQPHKSE